MSTLETGWLSATHISFHLLPILHFGGRLFNYIKAKLFLCADMRFMFKVVVFLALILQPAKEVKYDRSHDKYVFFVRHFFTLASLFSLKQTLS